MYSFQTKTNTINTERFANCKKVKQTSTQSVKLVSFQQIKFVKDQYSLSLEQFSQLVQLLHTCV